MIWKNCLLQELKNQTEDELGNMVGGDWQTIKKTSARFTPWTDEQVALEGREVTKNEQRFLIPIPFKQFPEKCKRVIISGIPQKITKKIDLSPRWTVIQVKCYKE